MASFVESELLSEDLPVGQLPFENCSLDANSFDLWQSEVEKTALKVSWAGIQLATTSAATVFLFGVEFISM